MALDVYKSNPHKLNNFKHRPESFLCLIIAQFCGVFLLVLCPPFQHGTTFSFPRNFAGIQRIFICNYSLSAESNKNVVAVSWKVGRNFFQIFWAETWKCKIWVSTTSTNRKSFVLMRLDFIHSRPFVDDPSLRSRRKRIFSVQAFWSGEATPKLMQKAPLKSECSAIEVLSFSKQPLWFRLEPMNAVKLGGSEEEKVENIHLNFLDLPLGSACRNAADDGKYSIYILARNTSETQKNFPQYFLLEIFPIKINKIDGTLYTA